MKMISLVLAFALALYLTGTATGQGYRLPEWVIDEGGVTAASSNYIANGSFHQTTIGYATGGNYIAWIGFWHPRPRWTSIRDVAALSIVAPTGGVDTGSWVTPVARLASYSNEEVSFNAIFTIYIAGGVLPVYQNIQWVTLQPGEVRNVSFVPVRMTAFGPHISRCSLALTGDTNPANDTVSGTFKVMYRFPFPEGWSEADPVPALPSGRGLNAGSWFTVDETEGVIYLAKANKTQDFYSYNPANTPTWTSLPDWPLGRENKKPGKGSKGCSGNDGYIYAIKGNNTLGFWRYNTYFQEWEQLPDVPYGPSHRKIKDGSDLVRVNRDGVTYIYLLKGYRNEFYRYNTLSGQWEELPFAPGTTRWYRGSWLVYDGENTIYAHKGKYHEFYAFDLATSEWLPNPLAPMPIPSEKMLTRKRAKDGSCATWAFQTIFALKGGNTCEFWRYFPEGDSWVELDTIPSVGSSGVKKRVRDGADIATFVDGVMYVTKGNKTLEFWRFTPGPGIVRPQPPRSGVAALPAALSRPFLAVNSPVTGSRLVASYQLGQTRQGELQLIDITGRTVLTRNLADGHGTTSIDISGIKSGVYLLRLKTGPDVITRKVIVNR